MLDHIRMIDENGLAICVRDIPTHVIEQHLLNRSWSVVTNDQGYTDPKYWVCLRLDVELVRRRLGIAIHD